MTFRRKMTAKRLGLGLALSLTMVLTAIGPIPGLQTANAASSNLTLTSSSSYLVNGFNWAKSTALGYVQTGGSNIPSYWGGYLTRKAFYSRDIAHSTVGAHLLGLDNENYTMLHQFAGSANASRKYYPLWAFGFDGSIFATDYKSDTNFVREIPAVFELVEKSYNQYLWTGNSRYLNDSTMWNYYSHAVNDFVSLHDANGNGVAEESGTTSIFQGVATYNEHGEGLKEAGDAIGSQYQALQAYSAIQKARGDASGASATATKAANLKSYFNSNWYDSGSGRYIRGRKDATIYTDFGKENSWFMPMKMITNPGSRTDSYLNFIDSSVSGMKAFNIEAYTYLPDTFYPWGREDLGWKWLKYIMDSRSTYPEVSFTVVGHIGSNMLGIQPDGPNHKVTTVGRLTSEVGWAQLDHVKVGGHDILVKHENANKTSTVKHNSGPSTLTWDALIEGTYTTLNLDKVAQTASQKTINGIKYSYLTVTLNAGQQKTVSAN